MITSILLATSFVLHPVSVAGPPTPSTTPAADAHAVDWVSLFDGLTLDGWRGDPRFWSVEDGCIVGRSTPESPCTTTTYLHHARPFADFVIEFDIKLEGDGGNSGLQYRSTAKPPDQGDGYDLSGYQADFDQRHSYTGILYETYGRGIAVGRGQSIRFNEDGSKRELEPARPDADLKSHLQKVEADPESGGWHQYKVVAEGRRLEHWIDGERFMLAEDHDPRFAARGTFALQVHQGPPMTVRVRNIRVKPLTAPRTHD